MPGLLITEGSASHSNACRRVGAPCLYLSSLHVPFPGQRAGASRGPRGARRLFRKRGQPWLRGESWESDQAQTVTRATGRRQARGDWDQTEGKYSPRRTAGRLRPSRRSGKPSDGPSDGSRHQQQRPLRPGGCVATARRDAWPGRACVATARRDASPGRGGAVRAVPLQREREPGPRSSQYVVDREEKRPCESVLVLSSE